MKQEPSREIQLLFFLDKPGRRKQSRHRAAHNVKQLVRNGLLPLLVVLDSQFLEKLLSVVCSHLHRYSPGGMLRGTGIQKYCINLEIQDFRKQDIQDSGSIRLDYVVEGVGTCVEVDLQWLYMSSILSTSLPTNMSISFCARAEVSAYEGLSAMTE